MYRKLYGFKISKKINIDLDNPSDYTDPSEIENIVEKINFSVLVEIIAK